MDLTAFTLFGRARYQVLACLFALREGEAIHLREVARRAGVSATAAQYELRLLVQAGLALQARSSGRTLYRANAEHPIAGEVRSILEKTHASGEASGIEDDRLWSRKRAQQRADYGSRALTRKSPFLADRRLASSLEVDFGGEREP
jgi:DNA-binding transcriptional ArsR family regulator